MILQDLHILDVKDEVLYTLSVLAIDDNHSLEMQRIMSELVYPQHVVIQDNSITLKELFDNERKD
jgi:hypothetical protein